MSYEFTPQEKREKLIEYLLVKVFECDWHGVSDAANDLRVLEAQIAAQPFSGEVNG